jgi:hypothetical protein
VEDFMRMVSWFGLLLASVAGVAGCVSAEGDVGRMDLALAAQTSSGTIYRLREATISVDGPAAQLVFHTEDDPDRVLIQAPTPAGHYALTLRDGWHLERIGADGVASTVAATLVSANPQSFEVESGQTTQVKLRFAVDGRQVQTGDGGLGIGIEVDEQGVPDAGLIIDAPIDAPVGDSCAPELPCPPSGSGKASVCGRILDVESGEAFSPGANAPVQLAVYDSVAYVSDPTHTAPLLGATPDACGRFVITDVPVPGTGYVSIAVVGGPASDPLVPTAVAVFVTSSGGVHDMHAYATRGATERAWSTGSGSSLAARGVYLALFVNGSAPPVGFLPGTPLAGVQITVGGQANSFLDYYFSNTDPSQRGAVNFFASSTGANGAALFVGGALDQYSGTGVPGCTFSSLLGATVPGLIVVQEHVVTCF